MPEPIAPSGAQLNTVAPSALVMLKVTTRLAVDDEPSATSLFRNTCMKGLARKLKARVAVGEPTTKVTEKPVVEPLRPEASAVPAVSRCASATLTAWVLVAPAGKGGNWVLTICASPRA